VKLDRSLEDWMRTYEIEEDRKARRGDLDIPFIGYDYKDTEDE